MADNAAQSVSIGARADELVRALRDEVTTLEELEQAVARQRQGVATNDQELIEGSIRAMGRTLLTLDAAKHRRQAILALLGGADDSTLQDLETILGNAVPAELLEARDALRTAAASTARELTINNHVLDRTLQAGDAFLQRLFSSVEGPPSSYAEGIDRDEPAAGSLFVNKKV